MIFRTSRLVGYVTDSWWVILDRGRLHHPFFAPSNRAKGVGPGGPPAIGALPDRQLAPPMPGVIQEGMHQARRNRGNHGGKGFKVVVGHLVT